MNDSRGTNEILLGINKTLNNLYDDVKAFFMKIKRQANPLTQKQSLQIKGIHILRN